MGSVDRHGPLELSRRRGSLHPPPPRSVRPGKAEGGGECGKKVNPKKERDQKGEANVPHRLAVHQGLKALRGGKFRADLHPFCARFLPDPKMKGQNLALTLAALMATCEISAASPGEKAMRV